MARIVEEQPKMNFVIGATTIEGILFPVVDTPSTVVGPRGRKSTPRPESLPWTR